VRNFSQFARPAAFHAADSPTANAKRACRSGTVKNQPHPKAGVLHSGAEAVGRNGTLNFLQSRDKLRSAKLSQFARLAARFARPAAFHAADSPTANAKRACQSGTVKNQPRPEPGVLHSGAEAGERNGTTESLTIQ
jgi:hypothetical protein